MKIRQRVIEDLTAAMKAKEAGRVEALRLIRAEILKKEKEKAAREVTDEVMVQLLLSMAKQRRESIEAFQKGGRSDLVAKEQTQLQIIESYLPAALDDSVIASTIEQVIQETGAGSLKDLGRVMGLAMKKLKETGGVFDGSAVNARVKARLEKKGEG